MGTQREDEYSTSSISEPGCLNITAQNTVIKRDKMCLTVSESREATNTREHYEARKKGLNVK
jgi:hypothetical protein